MAPTHFKSLERVFSGRDLFRGKALRALLWGVFASVALCLLLVDLCLVADLLETRGRLPDLPIERAPEFATLFLDAPQDAAPDVAETSADLVTAREEGGLRSVAWRFRDAPVLGPALRHAYHRIAWFRENNKSLGLLVLIAFAFACLRGVCLWRAESVSSGAALDVATRMRRTLHRQTLRLGPGDLTDPDGTQVIGLFTNEVDQVRDAIQAWIYRLGCFPSQLLLLVPLALAIHWRAALQCLILLGGCWFLVQRQRLRFGAARRLEEARAERRLRLLAEGLRKTRIVRGYGMEDFEHQQFHHHLEKFRTGVMHMLNMLHFQRLAVGFLVLVCVAAVTYVVGSKVLQPSFIPNGLSFSAALLMWRSWR